jgi:N-acetylglucosamine-6-phosphate deacetylase
VNGGGDVLFNNSPTSNAITTILQAHRKFGTTSLFPTLITDTLEKMMAAIATVEALVESEPGLLGVHLEGPYLSPDKAGVHDPGLMRVPSQADWERLFSKRKIALIVTIAPERVPDGFIRRLVTSGIRVSLGHSVATYDQTRKAISEGLTGFTHLFNAMAPLTSREPGPIAAALETPNVWFGLIVDGFHVSPAMLRLALRGYGHPMLVTDAMPPVGGSRETFKIYDSEVTVVGGRCLRSDGTLAGTALNMAVAIRNCVRLLGVSLEHALVFASRNPAEFLGLGHLLGKLAPNYRADMVAFDPQSLSVSETWVAGSHRLNEESPPARICH